MKKEITKSKYQQQKRTTTEAKAVDFSKSRKEITVSLIIVFFIPILLYLQTLTFKYTYFDDDTIIINNINVFKDFHNAPLAFQTDAFINGSSHFYRPLQTISLMIDLQLMGANNTWMYHLSNILLLGLTACLLFLLFRKFLIPLKLAVLSTLVYCAHPLFVSNIAWIPARGDLQLMLFSLLSFLLFIEFHQKNKNIYLLLHWAAFTVALFCKETAAFLPVLFITYYFIYKSEKRFDKKYLLNIVFYIISVICWFWIRTNAISDFSDHDEIFNIFNKNNEVGLMPVLLNLRTIPESLANFFIPFDIAPIPNFSLLKTMTGLIIIVLISILFFKNKERSKKEKIFCFSWFLILLIPTMFYKNNFIDYLNHRFFLPMIGIMLFILLTFPEKWFKNDNIKNAWLIIAIFIIFSSFTFIKSRSYSGPMVFYNSAISQNPNSDIAYINRGNLYNKQAKYDKAINDYTKLIELKPDFAEAYYNRGIILGAQGLYDKSITDFNKAVELKPDYVNAYISRGNIYNNQKMYNKAITDFTKAIDLKPDFAMAYNNRGVTYGIQGLYDKAIKDFNKAIELKPDYADAYCNRGNAYGTQGLFDKSCQDCKKAEELGSKNAKNNIIKFCK